MSLSTSSGWKHRASASTPSTSRGPGLLRMLSSQMYTRPFATAGIDQKPGVSANATTSESACGNDVTINARDDGERDDDVDEGEDDDDGEEEVEEEDGTRIASTSTSGEYSLI